MSSESPKESPRPAWAIEIGRKILRLRQNHRWSREDLASKALCDPPLSGQNISDIEGRNKSFDLEQIKRIALALGVRPRALLPDEFAEDEGEASVKVIKSKLKLSGGGGREGEESIFADEGEPKTYRFRADFWNLHFSDASRYRLVEVVGTSMTPILCHEDHCVVDLHDRDAAPGIFAVKLSSGVAFKEIRLVDNGFEAWEHFPRQKLVEGFLFEQQGIEHVLQGRVIKHRAGEGLISNYAAMLELYRSAVREELIAELRAEGRLS